MDARLFFEPQIARAAAARATPRTCDDSKTSYAGRKSAWRTATPARRRMPSSTTSWPVPRTIRLWSVMEVIDRLLEDSQARLFRSVERSEISLEGNRRILEAVLRHDEEAAQRAMAEHLEDISRNL